MVKIIATDHDMSNHTVTISRPADKVERTIQLLRECGYRQFTVEPVNG